MSGQAAETLWSRFGAAIEAEDLETAQRLAAEIEVEVGAYYSAILDGFDLRDADGNVTRDIYAVSGEYEAGAERVLELFEQESERRGYCGLDSMDPRWLVAHQVAQLEAGA